MLSVKCIIKITKMSINACIHFLLILCKSKEFYFTKCWIQIDAFRIGYLHGIVDMSVTLLLHSKKIDFAEVKKNKKPTGMSS